jgi:hypothetical protein
MRIASSIVQLTSTHLEERTSARAESLQAWIGSAPVGRPVGRQGTSTPAQVPAEPDSSADASAGCETPDQLSARDRLDLAILRKTFGLERDLTKDAPDARKASDPPQPAPAVKPTAPSAGAGEAAPAREGWGLRYDLVETSVQREATTFAARAQVTTADGRAISVEAALMMERTRVDVHEVHVAAGDAARVDPLLLNLSGGAASFTGQAAFDLDADGKQETLARLDAGSAWLALDRNGNGQVDSGAELFGPTTGSGFGELAALDQDANGWIDEGDAAYGSLRLWNQAAGTLQTLQAARVGAIYTRAAATPFEVRDGTGAVQAAVAETGLFLREDGSAGTVQHVDLVA